MEDNRVNEIVNRLNDLAMSKVRLIASTNDTIKKTIESYGLFEPGVNASINAHNETVWSLEKITKEEDKLLSELLELSRKEGSA